MLLKRKELITSLLAGLLLYCTAFPRVTRNVDLFINPDKANVDRLKKVLFDMFNDDSVEEITSEMLLEYPVVRYGSPDGLIIDLIVSIGEIYTFDDIEYIIKEVDGHTIKIATVETLYNMKKDTVRPVDASDAMYLLTLIKNKEET